MNKETVQRVLEINEEIKRLETARDAISGDKQIKLSYKKYNQGTTAFGKSEWRIVEEYELKPIRHILNLHDKMIRQEIDQTIEQLEKQLEAL